MGLTALLLVAVLAEVSVLGSVRHARAQELAYADLRYQLANASAPVGQTDLEGRPTALGTPVALLRIPAIDLEEVVLEGTTSAVLADGPGHRRDTPLPGQPGVSLLLGRQAAYGGPFGDVADLRAGDRITVTTGQGVHEYDVSGIRHAGDPAPGLEAGAARLTLVTASGPSFLPNEVVRVDADLVIPEPVDGEPATEPAPAPPAVLGPQSLGPAEQVMAGDRSGALRLFLWAQLLLLCGIAVAAMRAVWGRWQTWVVALPVVGLATVQVAHEVALMLPNLI